MKNLIELWKNRVEQCDEYIRMPLYSDTCHIVFSFGEDYYTLLLDKYDEYKYETIFFDFGNVVKFDITLFRGTGILVKNRIFSYDLTASQYNELKILHNSKSRELLKKLIKNLMDDK